MWSGTMRACLTVLLLAVSLGWGGAARGQDADAVQPVEKGEGDFPVLEELRRQKRELEKRQFEEKRHKQLEDIQLLIKRGTLQATADDQIRSYLNARTLLEKMWAVKPDPRVKAGLGHVARLMDEVPPPKQFVEETGLRMVLVGTGKNAVYVSASPVCRGHFAKQTADAAPESPEEVVTSVTWTAADSFCKWLSEKNGDVFHLPTVAELDDSGRRCPVALWTGTVWAGPTPVEKRMRVRFGVDMRAIWDPEKRLGGKPMIGELPFAHYKQLGVVVATDAATGVKNRLKRLKAEK